MAADAHSEDVRTFRDRARAWIRRNLPEGEPVDGLAVDDERSDALVAEDRLLQRRIADGGFAGIRYPKRYGGLELTRAHQVAWAEAAAGYRLPSTFNVTHGILGPTLLEFGTERHRQRHIPAMLRGDEMWVQFLSEPSGGSDLAGLLTRAERDGDIYLINGSKIWSTGAHRCQYGLLLARTDLDVPKHQGLSAFVVPTDADGLTITPIRLSTGASHFCQEFFDNVKVAAEDLIGGENDGWRVATRLLFHERNMVGDNSFNDHVVLSTGHEEGPDALVGLARRTGRQHDPDVRQLVGEGLALSTLLPPTIERVNGLLESGELPGPGAAILKVLGSTIELRRNRIALEIAGDSGVVWRPDATAEAAGMLWLGARTKTIAGGSTEIQLNQVSERVLGLPREASPDRDLPFREVIRSRR